MIVFFYLKYCGSIFKMTISHSRQDRNRFVSYPYSLWVCSWYSLLIYFVPHSSPTPFLSPSFPLSPYSKRVTFIYASYISTQWLFWLAMLSLASTISSLTLPPFQDQIPSLPMKPKTFLHMLNSRGPLFSLWYSYRILQYPLMKCLRLTQSFHSAW